MPESQPASPARPSTVQSIERAFRVLEVMAEHDGAMGLSQLARESGLSLPTIYRLVRTLVELGYMRQEPSRRYALGPRLIRLGESSAKVLSTWAHPYLERLVDELGESANLAMFDRDQVVYIAHVPSRHSMRMFTEVGGRVLPHCTGVGKALLADMEWDAAQEILKRTGMPYRTDNTITEPETLAEALAQIAEKGYAIDDGEQEVGVRCVAVAVPDVPTALALSVSGPSTRMTAALVERAVPLLTEAGRALSDDLNQRRGS